MSGRGREGEPMGVDLRTRRDGAIPAVDPGEVMGAVLPRAFAERSDLVDSASELTLRPLIVNVDGCEWTLQRVDSPAGDRLTVDAGRPAGSDRIAEVRLDAATFAELVNDLVTPVGLMTADALDMPWGRIGTLLDWWLVWRAAFDDRPVHRPGDVTVHSDLGRSFTLRDDPAEMLTFLEDAGFLHLRGVFTAEEMAAVAAGMDEVAPGYSPGDGASWWATVADGSERLVRMQGFEHRCEAGAAILADPRFAAIGELPGCGHTQGWASANRLEALYKPIGVQAGISDVPWHKDCSLGRHSYACCSLTVGISVTGGGPTSGQLRVVAGSHRALVWPSLLDVDSLGLPVVDLPTETGDVTVHLSCTLHMAQPPTERERKVLYTGFSLPPLDPEAARANAQRLNQRSRERAPVVTSQAPAG